MLAPGVNPKFSLLQSDEQGISNSGKVAKLGSGETALVQLSKLGWSTPIVLKLMAETNLLVQAQLTFDNFEY